MLALIKLLYSLSTQFPMIKELCMDGISLLRKYQASERKKDKDQMVNDSIAVIESRMRISETRERTKANEQE